MLKYKFSDASHDVRNGYDSDTGAHVATITKSGETYYMSLIDVTAEGSPARYVGARQTLSDAQTFVNAIYRALRTVQVEQHRRGELSTLEKLVIMADQADHDRVVEKITA